MPPPVTTVRAIDYGYAELDAGRDPPIQTGVGNDVRADVADVSVRGLKQFRAASIVYNRAAAIALDRASDGLATWERWVGTAAGNGALRFGENGGLHVVYGPPTPEMPRVGAWTCTFTGGTAPTLGHESSVAGRFLGGTVQADFGAKRIGVNFGVAINDATYWVPNDGPITGSPILMQRTGFAGGDIRVASAAPEGCSGKCTVVVAGSFHGAATTSSPPPGAASPIALTTPPRPAAQQPCTAPLDSAHRTRAPRAGSRGAAGCRHGVTRRP